MGLEVHVRYEVHNTTNTDVFRCAKASRTMVADGTAITFTDGVHVQGEQLRRVEAAMYRDAEVVYAYIVD